MQGDIVLKSFEDIDIKSNVKIFPIITVYHNTDDYPEKYVARLFDPLNRVNEEYIPIPTPYITLGDTFEEIEKTIPFGMYFLNRNEEDEITIVGSWI